MKKSELKQLIKPIVEECIQESVKQIVIDSGLLASVINEVVKGTLPLMIENASNNQRQVFKENNEQRSNTTRPSSNNSQLVEQMKKEKQLMVEELKKEAENMVPALKLKVGGVDIFKDTKPIPGESNDVTSPLGGVAPHDPGVDISKLLASKRFNVK
jgi:hypothetical protein